MTFKRTIVTVGCLALFFTGCANPSKKGATADKVAPPPIKAVEFDIPIVVNDKVLSWIDFFQGAGRERFTLYLERSHRYLPMMRAVLKQNGLPEDLVYVALIESGFNPKAFSRARASGPWQFIYRTGVRYGLKANVWVDERRDPEKSTIAAAQYLKDLYAMFNDWYLAMAGYNAGEGKVGRAIRRYETADFWEVSNRPYLRGETKNYVPKMIAAALIGKSPKKYGFKELNYHLPLDYEMVVVDGMIDLRVAARLAETTYEELKELNPELKLWLTPPNESYALKVPSGSAKKFVEAYASLTPEEKVAEKTHLVKRGETLPSIAKRAGLPLAYLTTINKGSHVRAGQSILIPYAPPEGERWALIDESKRPTRRHRGHQAVAARKRHRKAKMSRAKPTLPAPKVATTEKEM